MLSILLSPNWGNVCQNIHDIRDGMILYVTGCYTLCDDIRGDIRDGMKQRVRTFALPNEQLSKHSADTPSATRDAHRKGFTPHMTPPKSTPLTDNPSRSPEALNLYDLKHCVFATVVHMRFMKLTEVSHVPLHRCNREHARYSRWTYVVIYRHSRWTYVVIYISYSSRDLI